MCSLSFSRSRPMLTDMRVCVYFVMFHLCYITPYAVYYEINTTIHVKITLLMLCLSHLFDFFSPCSCSRLYATSIQIANNLQLLVIFERHFNANGKYACVNMSLQRLNIFNVLSSSSSSSSSFFLCSLLFLRSVCCHFPLFRAILGFSFSSITHAQIKLQPHQTHQT